MEVGYNVPPGMLSPTYSHRVKRPGTIRAIVVDYGSFLWDWNKFVVLCFVDDFYGERHKKLKVWHNQIGSGHGIAPDYIRVLESPQ